MRKENVNTKRLNIFFSFNIREEQKKSAKPLFDINEFDTMLFLT